MQIEVLWKVGVSLSENSS